MQRYFFLLMIFMFSCENNNKLQKENIRNVSFEMPSGFQLKKVNSEDTEIYDIFYKNKRIGSCYYGIYYKPFVEDYSITEEKEIYQKIKSEYTKIYYSKYLDQDYKNGIYNDNYYYYDTINKNIAQVMLPKRSNKGLIGVYFDSIDTHKNKFAIVATELGGENQKKFLEIFKTIKTK
ncbi:hypothetical protein [Chryseobacterium rhizosphaerae]|uniref:hypothetical protein n=1 Tax=Chryseobacterium rhizosphaerae TaxID=395937 RepID=UPI003D12C56B